MQQSTAMSTFSSEASTATRKVYEQDGEEAREIAKVIPYFPFKGIPRFYDIGGFLSKPGEKENKKDGSVVMPFDLFIMRYYKMHFLLFVFV